MKILSINGSKRKQGNTEILIQSILAPAREKGVQTESISLGDYTIGSCTGCEGCKRSWDCVIKDDFPLIIKKVDEADAIILASPTYWYSVTSDMKRFIDRCYSLVQFPVDRSQWIGKYQETEKYCLTAAICEQHTASAMGNTLTLLTDFSRDIGLDVIESVKGLGFFEAGSIESDQNFLHEAELAGQNLLNKLL